jgi:hypothetical protein
MLLSTHQEMYALRWRARLSFSICRRIIEQMLAHGDDVRKT